MTNIDFRSILENLGYKLLDRGNEWRAKPVYRDSDSDSTLRILKEDGRWIDFARGMGGDFKKLVELSGGKFDASMLAVKSNEKKEIFVDHAEIFCKDDLGSIVKDHSYWNGRGISSETLDYFGGGIIKKGVSSSMYGRYVFPIKNNRDEFVGISGRLIDNSPQNKSPKWKHLGKIDRWVYPAFLNKEIILQKREIILVESIGDGLSLWEAGIKNFLVLFGLGCGKAMTKSLIAADPKKIIISTNNDSANNSAGNTAAQKLRKHLIEFFEKSQIEIVLPIENDWNETDKEDIRKTFNG
jgi:hypothetical protein